MEFIIDIRDRLDGFSANGFQPIGPTTVGSRYEGAEGNFNFQFSVEEEAPHRLKEIKLGKPSNP